MLSSVIEIAYLVAAVLFILGLKRLTSPATARDGNQLAALGMFIAVLATFFLHRILTPVEMIGGLVVGAGIGLLLARRIQMTSMPELVAAFNGFGGLASSLVAAAELARYLLEARREVLPGPGFSDFVITVGAIDTWTAATIAISMLIGTVTFSGSFIAFGKLSGRLDGNPVSFKGMRALSVFTLALVLFGAGMLIAGAGTFPETSDALVYGAILIFVAALALGVLLVIPIGGADMPVVVALLNSYSGLAAAATGFVLDNTALIVSGALVGASGFILTKIMCVAMNRSLINVLMGGFGGEDPSADGAVMSADGKSITETSAEDTAILLAYANQVVIVPGYGMAVAQAQHAVRELADMLQARGVRVKYAVHPVAGRMPGHMNVLLAEANVPYDLLYEMDAINDEFSGTDVSLVIGANDVVNPSARTNTASPIYGMPILNVDYSKTVVVLKRSMRPGYSGVENDLFYNENTRMLFGDARETLTSLAAEVKLV
jgi:H+-translocating NAD(P) transhydrogenase subunit beta